MIHKIKIQKQILSCFLAFVLAITTSAPLAMAGPDSGQGSGDSSSSDQRPGGRLTPNDMTLYLETEGGQKTPMRVTSESVESYEEGLEILRKENPDSVLVLTDNEEQSKKLQREAIYRSLPRKFLPGGERQIRFVSPLKATYKGYRSFLRKSYAERRIKVSRIALLGASVFIIGNLSATLGVLDNVGFALGLGVSAVAAVLNRSLVEALGRKISGFKKMEGWDIFTVFKYEQESFFNEKKQMMDVRDASSNWLAFNIKFGLVEYFMVSCVASMGLVAAAMNSGVDMAYFGNWMVENAKHAGIGMLFQGTWSGVSTDLNNRRVDKNKEAHRHKEIDFQTYSLEKRAIENQSAIEMGIISVLSTILVVVGRVNNGNIFGLETITLPIMGDVSATIAVLGVGAAPAIAYGAYTLVPKVKELLEKLNRESLGRLSKRVSALAFADAFLTSLASYGETSNDPFKVKQNKGELYTLESSFVYGGSCRSLFKSH